MQYDYPGDKPSLQIVGNGWGEDHPLKQHLNGNWRVSVTTADQVSQTAQVVVIDHYHDPQAAVQAVKQKAPRAQIYLLLTEAYCTASLACEQAGAQIIPYRLDWAAMAQVINANPPTPTPVTRPTGTCPELQVTYDGATFRGRPITLQRRLFVLLFRLTEKQDEPICVNDFEWSETQIARVTRELDDRLRHCGVPIRVVKDNNHIKLQMPALQVA